MTDDPRNLDDTQPFEDDELENRETDELADDEAEDEEQAPPPPAHRQGRGAAANVGMGGPRRPGGPAVSATKTKTRAVVLDPSLRIRDRVSELFVIGTLVVFGAILVNALAFGRGGAFSVAPTPQPTINVTPGPSGSAAPSASPAASPTVAPTAAPSAAPTQGNSPAASSSPAAT